MSEDEFDELYAAAYGPVVRYLYAVTGSVSEAEDCAQEAFAKAWASREKLDREANPEAWVRTVGHRLAVSRWRRMVRVRRGSDGAVSSLSPDLSPNHVALVTALKTLPEAQRTAIVLHHLLDLPIREVARETGVGEGTVRSRLSRGRSALSLLLAEPEGEFSHG